MLQHLIEFSFFGWLWLSLKVSFLWAMSSSLHDIIREVSADLIRERRIIRCMKTYNLGRAYARQLVIDEERKS